MIDTHCHLTSDALFPRVDQVIAAAAQAGVDRLISVSTTPSDAYQAFALTQRFSQVFSTVGVHPHYADQYAAPAEIIQTIHDLARQPRVVALGEMGLDCHYPDPPLTDQQRLLEWQLEVASELDLPIVIHNRQATDLTLGMLRKSGIKPGRFLFHCFTGELDELDKILAFGAKVGFTGITTFKSAAHLAKAASRVPADRIFVETDSPYLTPEPHRKIRPNEPRYVTCVADFVADQRGMSRQAFRQMADQNAMGFFEKMNSAVLLPEKE